ncbi:hypothetical protein [Salinispora vitiensis]|uniref:hypothetical protein n=1 Tax=Salinispora vitiensis TaxID=999544 RepID=UPI00037AE26A|nr:hypothetical protein [Salinispora vitiensis]
MAHDDNAAPRDPSGCSPDELIDLLTVGARFGGRPTMQAAVHLLTFTAFPHQHDAVSMLEFDNDDDTDAPVTAAFVRDWPTVESIAVARRWGTGAQRLVALAVSLASGEPVDLRDAVVAGGHAHARRVIEAMAIATGHDEMHALTPTATLDQLIG